MIEIKRAGGRPISISVKGKELSTIETTDLSIIAQADIDDIRDEENSAFPDGAILVVWNESGFGSAIIKEAAISRKGEGIQIEFSFRLSTEGWDSVWNITRYISALEKQAQTATGLHAKTMRLADGKGDDIIISIVFGKELTLGASLEASAVRLKDFFENLETSLIKVAKESLLSGRKEDPLLKKLPQNMLDLAAFYSAAAELVKAEFLPELVFKGSEPQIILQTDDMILRVSVKAKQGSKWDCVRCDAMANDILVLADFENKKIGEQPDFYVIDFESLREIVSLIGKNFPQIKITEDNKIRTPSGFRGIVLSTDQVKSYRSAWDKIKVKL